MTSEPILFLARWLPLHVVITVIAVLTYVISSHVMHQRRHPTAAIAWMLFILLLPYLALPAYLLFGSRKVARPRRAAAGEPPVARGTGPWAVDTIRSLGQPPLALYTDLAVHADGARAREALMATIDGAQRTIALCTFILGRDALGGEVVERLCTKAEQGVRVRLLLDGLGGLMERHPDLRRLTRAGGEFALFVAPWRSPLKGRTNLRDHRKLLVADLGLPSARVWAGGRNLAAVYFDGTGDSPPWRDLTFDARGPLVDQAGAMFDRDWAFANGQPRRDAVPEALPAPSTAAGESVPVRGAQLVASGPDQADDTVHALLITAAYRAHERLALATPYFVPESALLMALCMAARRGVAVDLLVPGRSNHRLSDMARGRAMRSLADAGGRIWLAPGMMHAKLAVIDGVLALAGSTNLDSRSLLLNYELMFAFHEAGDVQRFADWFDHERSACKPYVASHPGLIRDVGEGMLLWLGFQL